MNMDIFLNNIHYRSKCSFFLFISSFIQQENIKFIKSDRKDIYSYKRFQF